MLSPNEFTEEQKAAVKRLRNMGLSKDAAEQWVVDHALDDAPEVKHEVVCESLTETIERVRAGRFVVERLWQQPVRA